MKTTPSKAGLSLGISFAIYHSIWVLIVFLKLGKIIGKQYAATHFIRLNIEITSFSLERGLIGTLLAFLVGYALGYVFGFVWDRLK